MTPRSISVIPAGIFLSLLLIPGLCAAGGPLTPSINVSAGVEYYTWEEFDLAGNSLLRETGPRATFSLSADGTDRTSPGPVYEANGCFYTTDLFGNVDYSGHTQPPQSTPISSNTHYIGGGVEGTGGYRFKDVFAGFSVDALASLGWDGWEREISDTQTGTGGLVNGSTEDYQVLYTRLGMGLFHRQGRWSHRLQLGAKYPVDVSEDAHLKSAGFENIAISPKSRPSIYFRWDVVRLDTDGKRSLNLEFYYDSFRFDRSNGVIVGGQSVFQPESHQDVFGVRAGYYFNPF